MQGVHGLILGKTEVENEEGDRVSEKTAPS